MNKLALVLNKPISRYLIVGGSTFLIDFLSLVFTHEYLNQSLAISTTAAYWLAVTYNFSLTRLWTFGLNKKANAQKQFVLYLLLLGFNYIFTLFFISLVSALIYYWIAKIIAVVLQTIWTFYIYKAFIFKQQD
jgi:putative flippase GtrA